MNLSIDYNSKKIKIEAHLKNFKSLSEQHQFKEFLFCLLTPQSNAQKCWQAIEQLSSLKIPNKNNIEKILSTKTRFHITKTKHILQSKETWNKIKTKLNNKKTKELRNSLANNVKGPGLNEASHFLRNIGKSNNQIAILDRHILKNLTKHKIIKEPKIKSKSHYLEIENLFLNFAKKHNIPPDHLDLLWWSQENGELFK